MRTETMENEIDSIWISGNVKVSNYKAAKKKRFTSQDVNYRSLYIVLERDFRLTGEHRAQTDSAIAPEAFKTSSWWRVSKKLI